MKVYQTEQIRNLVLMGNSGSGKTTLAECMLFESGAINRRGDINSKNTASDFNEIELQNQCSIFSSLIQTEYKDAKINMLDIAGFDDFNNTIFSSFTVADCALMLINAQNGIEVGTQIQSRYIDKFKKPLVLAINQLEAEKANFEAAIEGMKNLFGNKITIIHYLIFTVNLLQYRSHHYGSLQMLIQPCCNESKTH